MAEFVCIVDDIETGLAGYEYLTTASCEEEALFNAQDDYPYGVVRAVHEKRCLDWLDSLASRAAKKRAQEYTPLTIHWEC
jgi:hypothetical protein